jgi:hypothetical protein
MASASIFNQANVDVASDIEDEVPFVISHRDIPECEGVPCHLWMTKCVSLHNEYGVAVGEGICHSVKSDLVVGSNGPLGDTHVVVQILKSLKLDEFPDDWRYSVRAWPITHVFYNGANLFNHERWYKFSCRGLNQGVPSGRRRQRGSTKMEVRTPELSRKANKLLSQESINLVSSQVCCKQNCVQPFSRAEIRLL